MTGGDTQAAHVVEQPAENHAGVPRLIDDAFGPFEVFTLALP
ncbi:hypothetical protein THITH_15460 [Thioalkalivibrio paradoxus ARh 1]|uniref:Uncharacterized protein n=1 Tax=Thioalkalivibrio paradoxus ARh 1 TaxID=713585 RepID=W0DTH3_9GAMM|nr:hypothetical protein THITH_15460 [Thioalkalivibrio paradoxus ARh 1]